MHVGYLFKDSKMWITRSGIRELLIREVLGGDLASHYGKSKTVIMLKEHGVYGQ